MAQFEYNRALNSLKTPEAVSALGNIREHRARLLCSPASTPTTSLLWWK